MPTDAMRDAISLHRQLGELRGTLDAWLWWNGTPEHLELLRKNTAALLEKTDEQ